MQKWMIFAGLILLMVMATGGASASEATFWEEYTERYIEKFGEDTYTLVTEPLTWESYTSNYIEKFGEDKFKLTTEPFTWKSYTSDYITKYGQNKFDLVNNQIPSTASRWDEMHQSALARMPSFQSWDEWQREAIS